MTEPRLQSPSLDAGFQHTLPKTVSRTRPNRAAAESSAELPEPVRGLVRLEGRSAEVVAFEEQVIGFFIEAADLIGALKAVASWREAEWSSGGLGSGVAERRSNSRSGDAEPAVDRSFVHQALGRHPDRYEPDLELRKLLMRRLETRRRAQLQSGHSGLERLVESVPATRGAKVFIDQSNALQTWHDKSEALIPIIKTFLRLS
jgi:hypothetical protein